MKNTQLTHFILLSGLFLIPGLSQAEVTADVTLVSDYRDNGVSNSDRKPALQLGLGYEHDSGLYISGWSSNVDYGQGEPQRVELEIAGGYAFELNDNIELDVGIATYSYIGKTESSGANYHEYYVGATFFENTEFYTYYTRDYFQEGTGNLILSLSHEIELNEYTLGFKAVHYQSDDKEIIDWREGKADYQDFEVSIARDWQGFNFELAAIATTITDGDYEDDAKPTAVLSISKAWSW